jgi:hypothetical protein
MQHADEILAKFKPVVLSYDTKALDEDIGRALPALKRAVDRLTQLYLRQQDEELPQHLQTVMQGGDQTRKAFYQFFLGPWNPLDHHKSMWGDVGDRSAGCAFYPKELTAEAFNQHVSSLPKEEKERFVDSYTVIRKDESGKLLARPYHEYYRAELEEMRKDILEAAGIVKHASLKEYLTIRAESLVNGDYRAADSKWVQLRETPLELVYGPYEVYNDSLLGLKASYEAMIFATDEVKGRQLKEIEENLQNFAREFSLPGGSASSVGNIAPIVVVNMLYGGGEARQGVMASAFNLPNDAWVRGNIGWKQVMISNVMEAKFQNCSVEIARRIFGGSSLAQFDSYFFFVLLHEVSHGLGPAFRKDGTEVAKSMGSYYTAIEETKADTGALHLLLNFSGRYGIPGFSQETIFDSYTAGLFRSMRFGLHEAHGAANVIQYNWLKEKKVILHEAGRPLQTDTRQVGQAVRELLDKLCELQAHGSLEEIRAFTERYTAPDAVLVATIESLADIPVDIRATFAL